MSGARRWLLALIVLITGGALALSACSSSPLGPSAPATPTPVVTADPADGAVDVSPTHPVTLRVTDGTLGAVALTNAASGKAVSGLLSPDQRTYTIDEPLGFGVTYEWTGSAVDADGKATAIDQRFATLAPSKTISVSTNIGDDQTVGIAAPIMLQFSAPVADKAAVERAVTITTNPPTEGAWAWVADDNGGSRLHYRPREYWVPGTVIDINAKLYGLDIGGGTFGASDMTLHFDIGRSQIVKANAASHRMQVVRDGETVLDIPVSYGEGNEPRNVTRSGIHVVTEKHQDVLMSNPPYYENVRERWAVRISNNGEFIHANPLTTGVQGSANVTNGCINLSDADAQTYFGMALYGDPVEVTNTSIALSEADGDIYDWAMDWATWTSLSALA